jgi:hypothetical protein
VSARDRHRKELDRQRRELCDDARDNLVPGLVAAAIGCRSIELAETGWSPFADRADVILPMVIRVARDAAIRSGGQAKPGALVIEMTSLSSRDDPMAIGYLVAHGSAPVGPDGRRRVSDAASCVR